MKFIERFSRKSASQPHSVDPGAAPLLMALEPRIMFDASVGVVAQDAAQATAEPAKDSTSTDQASTPVAASADTRPSQNDQRQEVVFVDGQVTNIGELLEGLSGNPEVVILDSTKDGLQQMADYLKGRDGLDAIHLLSHGADGNVQVGNVWLAGYNLAEHREALESIGAALKADGDLMLYGCKIGETEQGQAFLDELASITGADVAASADETGAAILGGNWTLERSVGSIETTALGAQLEGYTAVMAAQFTGGADANAPVLGTGALSRMVVGDFNGDGRDDILFQTSNTVGAPWKFAAGKFGGGFTIVDRTDITSPFRNIVSMVDMANTGSNYYAADFDNDGDIDLLGVTVTLGPAYLYRNNNGVFESTTPTGFGGAQFGSRLVVGDFNGDGAADILYQPGTVDNLNSWRYALNNGNGTFTDVAQSASPFASFTLPTYSNFNYRVIDFEGDGDLDIIYMVAANPASLFLNNGNGTFALGAGGNIPIATFSQRAIFGDFDGDGDADMFWQIGANGTDWSYAENLGNGTFAATVTRANSPFKNLVMVDFGTTNFRIGDFDGDGDTDLLGTFAGTGASVYYQDGTSPKLLSTTPADESGAVSPSANIVLKFDQTVLKGTGDIKIVRLSDNQVIQTIDVTSGAVTGSGDTWTIDPPADLVGGVAYAVRIDSKTFVNTSGRVYMGIQTNTALNFVTSSIASPVISGLDGDSITYTEKGAPVLIDPTGNAVVTDADSLNFSGGTLTVTISSGRVNSEDVLGVLHEGTGAGQIGVSGGLISYNNITVAIASGGTGSNPLVFNFNSLATPTVLSALLHRLTYSNSNTTDIGTGARNIQVTLADGTGGVSNVANISLAITAVNDAPTATTTASDPTFTEGGSAVTLFSSTAISPVEASQRIDQIVFRVLNVGNGSSERLRIDGTDVALTNGNTVSTVTNGLSISVAYNSGTADVTISSAAGLTAAAANSIVNGMTYANDSKAPVGTSRSVVLVSVRDNGGGSNTTNVGTTSAVTLVAVNDAPTLAGGPYLLTSTTEDISSTGVQISTVLAGLTYSDPDSGALLGAAVTATTGNGTWQFSVNGVTGWTAFGTVSNSNALLLMGNTFVRYSPDNANGETATFTLRAWDQTSGIASSASTPRTGDTSIAGGSTAYSSGTATASIAVTNANDAPVLTAGSPTLPGLTDSQINDAGVLVSTLYSTNFTDVDNSAVKGIAITSLNAGNGTWQYSLNGTTWNNIGAVSVNSALLLRSTDHVRFVPNGISGTTADFTFRAWDQTGITNGMHGTKAVASSAGGTTPFSVGFNTASITVTAVNDAPTLTGSGGNLTWTEGNNTTSIPVVVDSGLTITDADGPYIASATARISNNYSSGNDSLELVSVAATMGNIIGTWDAGTGTLTLTSAGNLASLAQFQAALQAVTFTNLSDTPTVGTRTVEFKVNDGSLDSLSVSRNILISAVDDAPVITAPTSITVVEDVATVLGNISINDPDSVNIVMTLSVTSGTLGAIGGSGVAVGGTATAMTLSGTIANVNAFISNNRVTYTTAANATADATLTVLVDTGSVGTDTKTITLAVTPVNDAPVVSVPVSLTVTEDVPGGVTNISFSDVDAGNASVTATFSVPSGVLRAVSGSGVTVDGSGTGTLTLSGSLSDINTFIAATRVSFQTALNSTDSVLLTVSINDNGNTGGAAQTDSKTVTINVTAVNDAPVNSVPGAQSTKQNTVLAFNDLKGNAISVSDPDAGSSNVIVILNSVNGTMSLTAAGGVTFVSGDGVDDTSMRMQGTLADLNATLQSLTFKPTTGFLGNAQMSIQTNDMGFSGSGGAKTDFDLILITVVPANPAVTSVSAQGLDRAVKIGDEVLINMVFDQTMNVDLSAGTPSLLLETGLLDRSAVYVSGSGSNTLVFKYIVQAGDTSADLDFQSTTALQLNSAVLTNTTGDVAILTLPTVGGADSLGGRSNIVVDGVVPVVTSVGMPSDGSYIIGQNIDFTVNFSENVVVSTLGGFPRIAVTLDTGGTVYAQYASGSGSNALVFRLVVASGQLDSTGVTLGSSLDPNGGSIRDAAGNDSVTALNNVASPANVKVDGVVPTVVSVAVPADGSYKAGSELSFTLNASEAVQIGGLPPRLVLNVGGATRYATYVSGSGSAQLVFKYIVQNGDTDTDGIAVTTLDLRGESLTDLAGNNLNLTLNGLGSTAGVVVDTTAPSASGIARVDATPTNNGSVSFTVTFSEDVSNVDASDFALALGGTANGSISTVTRVNGSTWTVLVTDLSGVGTLGLNLNGNGTGIVDAANNAITGGFTGAVYGVDRVAPAVTSVDVPANGSYVAGRDLDFTVHLDDVVQLDTTGGSPRLEITLDNGATAYANYLSGAGTNALVFRLTVVSGQIDSNGISVGSSIDLHGATLRDAIGNDANLTLNGLGNTNGVLIDAVVPVVASVSVPAAGGYKAGEVLTFTVNVSETVNVLGANLPRLVLDIGGVTRYADYAVGSGTTALVFQYTVQAGDTAANGISVGNALDLNGGSVTDPAGNNLTLALNGTGNTAGVVVDTTVPTATGINRLDATPSNNGAVSYTVTFSENVSGVDRNDFALVFTGSANGTIASVTQVDGRTYTVLVDNLSGSGSVGLNLNSVGTGITDTSANALNGGLTGEVYGIDRVAPSVTSVDVPANGSYVAGQNLDFTVHLDEAVLLDSNAGTPRLEITLDNGVTAYANYLSGAGSNTLVFRLTVVDGQLDSNGISVGNAIQLNGATLRDALGNDANLTLNGLGNTTGVLVDAVVPAVGSVTLPGDGNYKAGDVLSFTVNTSEPLLIDTSTGTPRLVLNVGGVTRYATYVSGAASGALLFQYSVQAGDTASTGISVNSTLDLNGGRLADAAGNNLNPLLTGLGNVGNIFIDTTAPSAGSILRVDASPSNAGSVRYTVTFSEDVNGVDAADFNLFFSGTASANIASVTRVDGRTYTVLVDAIGGAGSLRLDLNASGTGITDATGNAVAGGLTGASYSIDRIAPSVTSVDLPANGTYVAGQNLDFTVNLSEAVRVDTSTGTPRIAVTLDTGGTVYANYLSGAGTNALVFRLTIANGQLDANGISLGNSIQLNGATVRDTVGNNAVTTLNGVPGTALVRVDAVVPSVVSVGTPPSGAYNAGDVLRYTLNVSEPVNVDTSSGTPRVALNIGGLTRYANYVSGSGTSALVFEYTIAAGNNSNGISLGGNVDLNGGTVRDAAGNALNLAVGASGATSTVVVDTIAPQVRDIVRIFTSPTSAEVVVYKVTFDESVSGVDTADFSVVFSGTANGRLASVTRIDGRTYEVRVDNLTGTGNVRLDLNGSGTGIVDAAGNPLTGGLAGSIYSIDRDAPSVTSVDVPAGGTYTAGQHLDFIVHLDEPVLVELDDGDGMPRLAVTLDNGRVAYADYLSGSGSRDLVFRLNVTAGMSGSSTFAVAPVIDFNGASISDARGTEAHETLNNMGSTSGIQIDAKAPRPSSIVVDGPVQPGDRTLSFTLSFDEAVSGVDAGDFSVLGTGSASGVLQSVQQIDAKTYRIVVGDMRGQGALALSLNAIGSGIRDQAGNTLSMSLVGQAQTIQSQDVGDLEYRLNPPQTPSNELVTVPQLQAPFIPQPSSVSPLVPASLFEIRTVGGDLKPLGTIFLGTGGSAPSFIAQVFGSSDSSGGLGGDGGFLGFGGGEAGVFGASTFAGIFGRDVPGVSEMNVFNGNQWKQSDINQGLRGVFGVPTFGQQLHQINEAEQRHVRGLAMALAQPAQIGKRA